MTTIKQTDRDAAADMWRDYVAKPGECIVERQMRSGEMDEYSSMIQAFARHSEQGEAETVAGIVAFMDWATPQVCTCLACLSLREMRNRIEAGEWKK